jgi:excisionase family DNA binding protein
MLTVPEAARRTGRNPETIRRWIRSGRLAARKVGTQHVIEEADLQSATEPSHMAPLPAGWRLMENGEPMPDVVAWIEQTRSGR